MRKELFLLHCFIYILIFPCFVKGQVITTVAGDGVSGFSGDSSFAVSAELSNPWGVTMDSAGNIYVADYVNSRIRKIDTSGNIITIAGGTLAGYDGDGSAASSSSFNFPQDVATDLRGNIYIADAGNDVIRMINSSGIISTIAGNDTAGFSGDGSIATSAELDQPVSIAVDRAGNIYIADYNNNRIRKVNTSGIITTIAGNGYGAGIGSGGYSGDGGAATDAELFYPTGVAVDRAGNVYIADADNNAVRKVNTLGIISTVAGTGAAGYSGDGGTATLAKLFTPSHVALDTVGNLYISDPGNSRIRKVNPAGIISTIVGTGSTGFSGDGRLATLAKINNPEGLYVAKNGSLYIADEGNSRIRMISSGGYFPAFTGGDSLTLSVCGHTSVSLGPLLAIQDSDIGQEEIWTVTSFPAHGLLGGFPAVATSAGAMLLPEGLTYTPDASYIGRDAFTVKVSDGIKTASAIVTVTVMPVPYAGIISGPSYACLSRPISFSDSATGGLWSVTDTFVSVSGDGVVYSVAPGTDTVIYSVTNTCGTARAIKILTVYPIADAGTITGPVGVCVGDTISFSSVSIYTVIDTGGIWSTSNSAATITADGGYLRGVTADTVTVFYMVANSCDTSLATLSISVDTAPDAGIIRGLSSLCPGYAFILADTSRGGVWHSSNIHATVTDGLVIGVSGGADTISYVVDNTCGTAIALKTIIIHSDPVVSPVTGPSSVCVGSFINIMDTASGGEWSPSNSFAAITGSGEVLGLVPGKDTMTYIVTNICGTVSSSAIITIDPSYTSPVVGKDSVCQGHTITLTDSMSGGIWGSEYPSIASVSSAGVVTGLSPGMDSVAYTVVNSCGTGKVKHMIDVISTDACDLTSVAAPPVFPQEGINVYPNPNEGSFILEIHAAKDGPIPVVITNIAGEIIMQFIATANKSEDIKLNQPPGIYILAAITTEKRYMMKLIVN